MSVLLFPRYLHSIPSRAARQYTSSRTCKTRYGFIGLGQMGARMSENLLNSISPKNNDTLRVFDAYKPAMDSFMTACPFAIPSQSSSHLVRDCDIVILSLPNTRPVQSVFAPFIDTHGEHASDSLDGKLFIDTSTISPAATKTLSDSLKTKGASLLDAPMSGGIVGAKAGTLTFMVSKPPSVPLETIEGILLKMGKKVIVCGDYPGAGLAAKLANNYALAITNLATCDAMLLGMKLGLDPKVLANVLNTSTGRSWPSEVNNPVPGVLPNTPPSNDYNGGFGIALMKKDLELALQADKQAEIVAAGSGTENKITGQLSDMSKVAMEIYNTVQGIDKYSKKDFSVIYQYLREGVEEK